VLNKKQSSIIKYSLSTLMAVEGDINSKNPKTFVRSVILLGPNYSEHSENYWTKKKRKSPVYGCQAI
jgi:hypothetical protein